MVLAKGVSNCSRLHFANSAATSFSNARPASISGVENGGGGVSNPFATLTRCFCVVVSGWPPVIRSAMATSMAASLPPKPPTRVLRISSM